MNRLLGEGRTMENKAGGSELPGTCVGRIHPGPGCCLFLLSGSGHCEEASSLPTLPSWYDCFASHLRAVVSGSHGLNTVHPRAIVNPHSCLLLLSYTCQNNEKPAHTIICCLGFCDPQFEKHGTGIFCFSLSSS